MNPDSAQPSQPVQQQPAPAASAPASQPQPSAPQAQPGAPQDHGGGKAGILIALLVVVGVVILSLFAFTGGKKTTQQSQTAQVQTSAPTTAPVDNTQATSETIKAGNTSDDQLNADDQKLSNSLNNIDQSFNDVDSGFNDQGDGLD